MMAARTRLALRTAALLWLLTLATLLLAACGGSTQDDEDPAAAGSKAIPTAPCAHQPEACR